MAARSSTQLVAMPPIVRTPQPPASPPLEVDARALTTKILAGTVPQSEVHNRPYYGKNVDLARIENAIVWAEKGYMATFTDVSREAVKYDPNLAGLLLKRFGNISVIDWDVSPADGYGLDRDIAKEIADDVRQMLAAIKGFRQALFDLVWARFDGRAAEEIQWAFLGGKRPWRPLSLDWIHPARLSFGPERELRVVERPQLVGYFKPYGPALRDFPGKYIWWMPRMLCDYQEREGLAPSCLYWAFFKRFSWRHRMMLTELFGLPWRIVEVDKEVQGVHGDQLEAARQYADALGGSTSAAFPPGMRLRIESGNPETAEFFGMSSDDVDKQMERLIAGTAAIMSADPTRANAAVGAGQFDLALQLDGNGISERVIEQLIQPYIELNRGQEALVYTPKFQLRTQPPRDRKAELDRVKVVVDMGVPVEHTEVREIAGLREPKEGAKVTTGPAPAAPSLPAQQAASAAPAQDPIGSILDALGKDLVEFPNDGAKDLDPMRASLVVPKAAVIRAVGCETAQLKDLPRWLSVAQLRKVRGLDVDDVARLITQASLSRKFVDNLMEPAPTDG